MAATKMEKFQEALFHLGRHEWGAPAGAKPLGKIYWDKHDQKWYIKWFKDTPHPERTFYIGCERDWGRWHYIY